MSLCVMYPGYEQQLRHRDGRNNKADRSRHLWQPWVERAANLDDRARALSLRCSAMEGTVGTVGKWKRERRHRAVFCSALPQPQPHSRSSLHQEPLDMTTTSGNGGGTRAAQPSSSSSSSKERASVIIASPPATGGSPNGTSSGAGGMSDPVIDEHFRRSLGKDYMNVFAPAVAQREHQQQPQPVQRPAATAPVQTPADAGLSAVDDHFAKALGDTWVQLQKEEYQKKGKETTATADSGRQQKVNVYAA